MPTTTPNREAGNGSTLANFVRNRRVELDLTKAEAARRAGVSRRTWNEVEYGHRTTSSAVTLSQFDQALQLKEGTLFAMSADAVLVRVRALRAEMLERVRKMSAEQMESFLTGTSTATAAVEEVVRLNAELRHDIKADLERMREEFTEQIRQLSDDLHSMGSKDEQRWPAELPGTVSDSDRD